MKRLLLSLVGALMLFAAAPIASASTVTFDDVDTGDIGTGAFHKFNTHTDHFVDTYVFTVAHDNTSIVLDFTLKGTIALTDLVLSNGLSSLNLGALPPSGSITLSSLMTGTKYFLDVIGAACSCSRYDLEIADVKIGTTPIPPALLLFITAVGGLGAVGWRRRKTAPALTDGLA
jgi:hypothetical protein